MERFETFTLLIARISRSIKRIKSEEMAEFRLKGPHVTCLYYLSVHGEMTAAELCEHCDEDKAAVSRSLDYLERNGYVACVSGASRRYKAALRLTEKGETVCTAMGEKITRIVDEASEGLRAAERAVMYRALTIISGNLENIYEEKKRAGAHGAAAEEGEKI